MHKSLLLFSLGYCVAQEALNPLEKIKVYPHTTETYNIGFGEWDIMKDGEALIIDTFIKQGDVIIDAGAHTGEWSSYVLQHTQANCSLYAFEPVPAFYESLKRAIGSRGSCYNVALGRDIKKGFMNYFYEESQGCSSLFDRPVLNHVQVKKIPIIITSLDTFCIENHIDAIDFLKIDTEGSELAVLHGAHRLISNRKISFIQFEYGGTYPDANITLFEVFTYLTAHDYAIYRIAPDGIIHINQWESYLENNHLSNYLAIRK